MKTGLVVPPCLSIWIQFSMSDSLTLTKFNGGKGKQAGENANKTKMTNKSTIWTNGLMEKSDLSARLPLPILMTMTPQVNVDNEAYFSLLQIKLVCIKSVNIHR